MSHEMYSTGVAQPPSWSPTILPRLAPGATMRVDGLPFVVAGYRAHRTPAGITTTIVVEGCCATCSAPFSQVIGPVGVRMAHHCPAHRPPAEGRSA